MSDEVNYMQNRKYWTSPLVSDHGAWHNCDAVNKNNQPLSLYFFFLQVLYLVSLWSFSLVYYLKSTHFSCTYLSNWTCMLLEELVMRVICVINYGVVKLYSIVSFLSVSLLSDLYTVNQMLWSGGWDYSLKFYTWRLCPGSNPLLVFYTIQKGYPFLYACYTYFRTLHSFSKPLQWS